MLSDESDSSSWDQQGSYDAALAIVVVNVTAGDSFTIIRRPVRPVHPSRATGTAWMDGDELQKMKIDPAAT